MLIPFLKKQMHPLTPENILNLNKLIKGRRKLLGLDLKDWNYEKTKEAVFENLGTIIRPIYFNNWETLKGSEFHRAIAEKDFDRWGDKMNPDSFSHPLKDVLKGRANLAERPVLYTSDSTHTAIYEIFKNGKIKEGESFYESIWEVKPDSEMHTIMLLYNVPKDHVWFKEIDNNIVEKFRSLNRVYPKALRKSIEYLTETFCDLFVSDKYDISSAIAYDYLYENRNDEIARVDCLLYPSVKKMKSGYNFAFHPDFVKETLFIKVILKQKLVSIIEENALTSIEEIGIVENGKISWFKGSFNINKMSFLRQDKTAIKEFNIDEIHTYTMDINGKETLLADDAIEKLKNVLQKEFVDLILEYRERRVKKNYFAEFDGLIDDQEFRFIKYEIEYFFRKISGITAEAA